jgi:hypothetical protein
MCIQTDISLHRTIKKDITFSYIHNTQTVLPWLLEKEHLICLGHAMSYYICTVKSKAHLIIRYEVKYQYVAIFGLYTRFQIVNFYNFNYFSKEHSNCMISY